MTESVNQLMNDEAVCRTAPATPGLLIMGWGLKSVVVSVFSLEFLWFSRLFTHLSTQTTKIPTN